MENSKSTQNSILKSITQPPKRTLPIYFPLIWAGRMLGNGTRRYWKKTVSSLILFVMIFAMLFYVINLDIHPTEKKSSSIGTSFAGVLAQDYEVGKQDVSAMDFYEWAAFYRLNATNGKHDDDPDGDELPNYLEYAYKTDPMKADTDKDGFSDKQEILNGYDPDSPGDAKPAVELTIPKIGVSAPVVWSASEDEKSLEKDLENGVVHFPKTSAPGQTGNMIVTGHSSNYIWAAGSYKHIFKDLNSLQDGDTIDFKVSLANGRVLNFHYKVSGKRVTTADDPTIFESEGKGELTLATCWPIGTNLRRLVVTADLVSE